MSSRTEPPEPPPSAGMLLFFQVTFFLVCLAVAVLLAHEGLQAVRNRAYTLTYTESTSWAVDGAFGGGNVEDFARQFSGSDAVVFGVGFLALAAMMLTWACGLGLSLLGRIGVTLPAVLTQVLGSVSLAGLSVGCLALFPPWRRHTMPLYFVVLVFTLAVTLPIPDHLRKKVFPAVVGLVILVGMTGFPAFPIFAGIFVFFFAGANVLVMWPGLGERIERGQTGRR